MPRSIFQIVLVATLALLLSGCGNLGGPGQSEARKAAPRPAPGFGIVYFDVSKAEIEPQYETVIEKAARKLNANKRMRIVLAGHSDRTGSRSWNMWIAKLRARAVREALITLGVNPRQLRVVSYGPDRPVVGGKRRVAQAKNRRVEFAQPR